MGEKQDAEILYSVKDVSEIEQGRGGFVSAVKCKIFLYNSFGIY